MYYVYILRSLKNHRLYTGSTNDIARRLAEHNAGKGVYARSVKPFILLYKEEYQTRSDAVQRERFFKTGKGRKVLKELIAENSGV